MRRIRLTGFHKNLANGYAHRMQENLCFKNASGANVKVNPLSRLKELSSTLGDVNVPVKSGGVDISQADRDGYKEYVDLIISLYPKGLLYGTPSFLKSLDNGFNRIGVNTKNKLSINGQKKDKAFHEIIVETMQYKLVRQYIMPGYIRKMGIKTCVYCNANYTITDSKRVAYYQLDHWKNKADYPYLCISFFNLQPSCSSCNLHKSSDNTSEYLNLYEDRKTQSLDVFKFRLDKQSLVDYLCDFNRESLKVSFEEICSDFKKMRDDTDRELHITDIYNEHKDHVEEVIWRHQFGRESFLKALNDAQLGFTIDEKNVDRFILGTYSGPEDVHKRPLTKLKQDVAKDLGLI